MRGQRVAESTNRYTLLHTATVQRQSHTFHTGHDLRFVGNPIMHVDESDGEIDILLVDCALVEVPFPLFDVNSVVEPVALRGRARVSVEGIPPPLFCYHRDSNCPYCCGAELRVG